jgi:hypothetical protein
MRHAANPGNSRVKPLLFRSLLSGRDGRGGVRDAARLVGGMRSQGIRTGGPASQTFQRLIALPMRPASRMLERTPHDS